MKFPLIISSILSLRIDKGLVISKEIKYIINKNTKIKRKFNSNKIIILLFCVVYKESILFI
ncbi:hypothetical protein BTM21_07180 [Clostridium chauvoei]|nr:hypothetical protein BTM21_07180 [Clostridium chauvoei]